MSTDVDEAPIDAATLAWEGDRVSYDQLDGDTRRLLDGISEHLFRAWPRLADPQDAIDAAAYDVLAAELEDAGLDTDEPIGPQLEQRATEAREEGVKDATIPSRANTGERKAMRLLLERRLEVIKAEPDGFIHARCKGDEATYDLGYDPSKRRWRCTCPELRGACSHLIALKMITTARETG
jgi:hypothetical protein